MTAFTSYAVSDGNITIENGIYSVKTPKGNVAIKPISEDIYRVTVFPPGVTLQFPESKVTTLNPSKVGVCTNMTGRAFLVCSQTSTVRIDLSTGKVTFYDAKGKPLLEELEGVDNSGIDKKVSYVGSKTEKFYGVGESGQTINLNHNDTIIMSNMKYYDYAEGDINTRVGISVPYFVSDYGYAVLFDDNSQGKLVLGDAITYTSEISSPLSYYFINGRNKTLAQTIELVSNLVDRRP